MENDPARLPSELLQVAALAVSWIEKIDERQPELQLEEIADYAE
jgi:hypothetical protein